MTSTITSPFDTTALRQAFANRDAAGLLALYADDATIEIVDADNTPSSPRRIEGIDALRSRAEDVFARDMTHQIDIVAADDDAVGYTLRCTYPDGTRVLCAATAELRDGKIIREIGVQAWDQSA